MGCYISGRRGEREERKEGAAVVMDDMLSNIVIICLCLT